MTGMDRFDPKERRRQRRKLAERDKKKGPKRKRWTIVDEDWNYNRWLENELDD